MDDLNTQWRLHCTWFGKNVHMVYFCHTRKICYSNLVFYGKKIRSIVELSIQRIKPVAPPFANLPLSQFCQTRANNAFALTEIMTRWPFWRGWVKLWRNVRCYWQLGLSTNWAISSDKLTLYFLKRKGLMSFFSVCCECLQESARLLYWGCQWGWGSLACHTH